MPGNQDLSDFIGEIYDAILEPKRWSGVLEEICRRLDAKAASIHLVDPVAGTASFFVEYGTDPKWTELLMNRYAAMSPIGAAVLLADIDQPVSAFDFIDEGEFVASRFYKEWCAPQGYHDMLGAIIAKKPKQVGAVSATRLVDRPRFGLDEKVFFGRIAPHVRRAVSISGLLESRTVERENFSALLDQLTTAAFLIDGAHRVMHVNAAGEALTSEGAVLTVRDKIIQFLDPDADRTLRGTLESRAETPVFIALPEARGPSGYSAAILPLRPKDAVYALFVHPMELDAPPLARHLANALSLTPREVTVLLPLLQGKELAQVSDELGISPSTVRTHLNRLFEKTGTSRQADLVQRVLKLLPPIKLG